MPVVAAMLLAASDAVARATPALETQTVDEIVVTADRRGGFGADLVQVGTFRGARLIDVPLTVNVVPREVLRAQAAQSVYQAVDEVGLS